VTQSGKTSLKFPNPDYHQNLMVSSMALSTEFCENRFNTFCGIPLTNRLNAGENNLLGSSTSRQHDSSVDAADTLLTTTRLLQCSERLTMPVGGVYCSLQCGNTALHAAASHGHAAAVRCLLTHGTNVDFTNLVRIHSLVTASPLSH